jgi:putative DNA primase/helicase
MPVIPNVLTRTDALEALARLNDLLIEFPFADDASRSVILSLILTVVCRGAFRNAPLHATDSNTPGSGKSFGIDVPSYIATGQPCPVLTPGSNDEETEKRVGAELLSGSTMISIDNASEIGGDALCTYVERPRPTVRVLGESRNVRVDTTATTITATGINLAIRDDLVRRSLVSRLDSNLERPELRQFRKNPVQQILANRGQYVADALTVCRAYFVAGRPGLLPRLASFEGWSDTVRSALTWLGEADPVITQNRARASDPVASALRAVFSSWASTLGTGRVAAKTAAELLRASQGFAGPVAPEFAEAIQGVATNRGALDAKTLGRWLGRYRGRIAANYRLENESDVNGHAAKWWLQSH